MAQRYKDEAGNIWEMGPNGQPSLVTPAHGPSLANPKLPGELTGQTLENRSREAALAKSPYELRGEAADAAKKELDLKVAREQYDAQHPKVSSDGLYGDDYLKTLSASDRNMVKALSEGRLAFPQGAALRAPFWQEKLSQVAQFDPTFDATNFNSRAQGRVNAIKGKLGQSNNALNTAIGHLGQLSDQISGTASHSFTPFNALENTTMKMFGDSGVTNFQDTAAKLADELEAVYRNGGGAEQGVARQLRSLDPNMSLEQKQGIVQNAMDLLASKMAANLAQYNFGTGGKPTWDMLDPHTLGVLHQKAPGLLDKYFAPPAQGGSAPPTGPTGPNGPPPVAPSGSPHPDYSGMVGPDQGGAATGPTRNIFDQPTAQGMAALIRHGRPYNEAAAFAADHNYPAPDPKAYLAAVAFAKIHGGATNVDVTRSVPTTFGQRLASSPAAGFAVGAGNAASAGFLDEMAGGLSALGGGDYTQSRDAFNAKKHILSDLHPVADLAGNVAGGVGVGLGGEAAIGKIAPGVVDLMRASKIAAPASDLAYGALYGAGENNENRLGGAATGGAAGLGGGMFARAAPKIAGRVIAPDAGAMGPLYDQGVMPTIGQRASAMSGPISSRVGKAVNTVEQAMQSVPILGALPASAREGARKEFQRGAFNDALGELGTQLPKNAGIGPEAHSFASGTFDKAYDTARTGMQFVADQPFSQDFAAFDKGLADGTLTKDQAAQVHSALSSSLEGRLKSGGMSGADYKAAVSDIQRKAATWSSNPNTSGQAHYLTQFANILDDAARRNSDPAAVALLDAADKGYAKFVRIQKASQLGGAAKDAGTFTPNNFASAVKSMGGGVRSNAYSRGDALGQDYAQAGLKLSDTMPDSGTPGRLATMGLLGGAEGAALATGHLGISPAALGMFAPYVGKLGNKLIAPREYTLPPALSQPLNLMGDGLYDRSGAIGRIGAPAAAGYFLGQ